MQTIKCLAIDDEYLALNIIKGYVAKVPFLELTDTSKSALSAIEILATNEIDLLFLDIQMPDISGIEFLKTLKNPPLVILTTAYQEYALSGYEYDVVDYLLKPIRFERFLKAVNKARELLELQKSAQPQIRILAPKIQKEYCFLKSGYKSEKVLYKDILYIEGQKEYIYIHTKGKKYVKIQSMSSFLADLPVEEFIQIHKSFIVAADKINAVYGNTVEIGDISLPIGRSYKDLVQKLIAPNYKNTE